MSSLDPVLLPAEVAERLRLDETTLAHWRSQGTGPKSFRLGRKRVAYMQSAVDAWLKAQQVAADEERSRSGFAS